jgi:hypothetical protein
MAPAPQGPWLLVFWVVSLVVVRALLLGGFVLCFVRVAEPSVYAIKQVGGMEAMSWVPYAYAASFCASVRFPALP